jgi:5-methyltetrahydropteroyltriglutamate--homocysteine methyltransferase
MSLLSPGLYLASAGSYPRFGDSHELLILRRTMDALAEGERTTADLLDAQNDMTRRAIAEQVQAGLDIITDGLIRWNDPISHLPGKLDNVRIDELLPFFDTQTYFRRPVLTGKLLRRGHLVAAEYSFARNALGHLPTPAAKAGKLSIKPVLTGPYTLAKYSVSENGAAHGAAGDLESRARDYAEVLAVEIETLAQGGAQLIQIDEPAILYHPGDWKIFESAIQHLANTRDVVKKSGRTLELALYTYFYDAAPLYEKLMSLPVDTLGLDLVSGPKLAATIAAAGSAKPLALGMVSGCRAEMEDAETIARVLDRVLPKIHGGRAYLGPSCGLEYLSRSNALAKLELLPKIQAMLKG